MTRKGFPCPGCRGERLHTIRRKTLPDGRRIRVRVCPACEAETALSLADHVGLCCPKCGDIRVSKWSTRYEARGVIRVRKCGHCAHKIRTRESVESANA